MEQKIFSTGAGELRAQAKMSLLAKEAFTLAEVLITLAIIGVVAAISIPSVISNSQQQEFKTGLRKAVSVLNSAITMNMALDGESLYDNANTYAYLMKHMAIVETTSDIGGKYYINVANGEKRSINKAFYTTDGMRFEFNTYGHTFFSKPLHETDSVLACGGSVVGYNAYSSELDPRSTVICNGCGSYGLNSNTDKTTKAPCLIMVDVNGDKKPNPANVNCHDTTCSKPYKYSDALGIKLTDLFSIMITDKAAMPYGVAAQRAMYQAQK